MSDVVEAIEGAAALVGGGFLFFLFGSALETSTVLSFQLWETLSVLAGILLAVTVVAAVIGGVSSR